MRIMPQYRLPAFLFALVAITGIWFVHNMYATPIAELNAQIVSEQQQVDQIDRLLVSVRAIQHRYNKLAVVYLKTASTTYQVESDFTRKLRQITSARRLVFSSIDWEGKSSSTVNAPAGPMTNFQQITGTLALSGTWFNLNYAIDDLAKQPELLAMTQPSFKPSTDRTLLAITLHINLLQPLVPQMSETAAASPRRSPRTIK